MADLGFDALNYYTILFFQLSASSICFFGVTFSSRVDSHGRVTRCHLLDLALGGGSRLWLNFLFLRQRGMKVTWKIPLEQAQGDRNPQDLGKRIWSSMWNLIIVFQIFAGL